MNAKHTPGPWHVSENGDSPDDGYNIVDARGLYIAFADGNDPIEPAEAQANARLIAAAPEMRDKGHHLAMLALQSDRYRDDAEYCEVVDCWLALLARIDGEADAR